MTGLDADVHFIGKLEILAATGATGFGNEGSDRSGRRRYDLSRLSSNEHSLDISQCGFPFLC